MFDWMKSKGQSPARFAEQSAVMDGFLITGQAGFVAGMKVASNRGWRAVEKLTVGDKALTFDHGMKTIVDIQREAFFIPEHKLSKRQSPLLVPKGVMNNRTDIWLMPDQGLLVESDAAMDALGDPFAVVPAHVLHGLKGIRRAAPGDRLNITTLAFAEDEVIYAEGGMLAYCPRPRCILTDGPTTDVPLYNILDEHRARFLVECMIEEDDTSALICDPEEVIGVIQPKLRRMTRPLLI